MKLPENISVEFNVIDQPQIRYSTFVEYSTRENMQVQWDSNQLIKSL
jgi:hypothetical protein